VVFDSLRNAHGLLSTFTPEPDEGGAGQKRAEDVTKHFNHAAIARARLDLGLTQEEAAAAAGVDVRTYRRYESGEVNDPVHGFAIRNPSRRRILRKLAAELGLAEDELLVEMADSPVVANAVEGDRWRVQHAHSLPKARHFVGRGDVVRSLHAWRVAPESEGVLAIVALGGAGKTSVAAQFVDELEAGPAGAGVFVWSFYEDRRVESFFAEALAYFSAKDEGAGHGERYDLLRATLREGPAHLLVLDGLEVLQGTGAPGTTYGRIEDPTLRRLLSGVARGLGRARCLVTSRFDLTDIATEGVGLRTVRLEPLSKEEGRRLLLEWGVSGGDAELSAGVARLGGHALSLAMVGSYVGTFLGGDISSGLGIGLESAAQDDPVARRLLDLLGTYAGALTPAERDLMARLSLFASGADLDALHGIARAGGRVAGALGELSESDVGRTLARLERLGLVSASRDGTRYATHPFVAEYFRSLVGVEPAGVHRALRDALRARLDVHSPGVAESARLDAYEELVAHTRQAGMEEEAWSIYEYKLGGFSHLGLRLGQMTRGARMLRAFSLDGDPAHLPAALHPMTRARLVYELGLYGGALGDLTFALNCYRAHNDLARTAGSLGSLAMGLRTLAYTLRLRSVFDEALSLVLASADIAHALGHEGALVRAIALRGMLLHDLGRFDEASASFAKARELGDKPVARRALWEAEHLLDLGRLDEARAMTEENIAACRSLGWDGHVAHGETVLGLAALGGSSPDVARAGEHLAAARTWSSATGEVEMILRCHELEARIELVASDHASAQAIDDGLELARSGGFHLFTRRFEGLRSHGPQHRSA
jgi:transcriptional regulator with XRE-family HTH domain/tetratricopeptide (TPR) repeat protein